MVISGPLRSRILAFLPTLLFLLAPQAVAQESIRLNQIGFYPDAPKHAVVVDAPAEVFYVLSADDADTVFTGTLGPEEVWPHSQERVRLADFSGLTASGRYVVAVPGAGRSHSFEVAGRVHDDALRAAIKSYYYLRASTGLSPRLAGKWARRAGHPDDRVLVHPSAATDARPAGTVISAPRGWYDAGDYNKYIVNSGITTATLLSLYEDFPAFVEALEISIPERGGRLPDLLDEALWNIQWMLAMQDPNDGGVYHKLTAPNFEGMVMPHEAGQQRYVVQKSTTAALDFAAVMAQGARIFEQFDETLPGFSDSLLTAAVDAWSWARRNPDALYDQNAMNRAYDPDVVTGAYGDQHVEDEFRWAAAELFVTTGADSFLVAHDPLAGGSLSVPGWPNVGTMAYYTLARHRQDIASEVDTSAVRQALIRLAESLVGSKNASAYGVPMGRTENDFVWGSNSVAANQGMALVQAYKLTGEPRYLDAALANLDYLLGRNALGYSFLTGHGSKTPLALHHRQSEADAVADPVPGLLAGGPNPAAPRQGEQCEGYLGRLPATTYIDHACSYATNENAINWNAPFVYLAGALEALIGSGAEGPLGNAGEVPPASLGIESFPNPAADEARVRMTLSEPQQVTVRVYDLLGREVRRLVDAEWLAAGMHERRLDTAGVAAGTYVIHLQASSGDSSETLVLVH